MHNVSDEIDFNPILVRFKQVSERFLRRSVIISILFQSDSNLHFLQRGYMRNLISILFQSDSNLSIQSPVARHVRFQSYFSPIQTHLSRLILKTDEPFQSYFSPIQTEIQTLVFSRNAVFQSYFSPIQTQSHRLHGNWYRFHFNPILVRFKQ